MNRETYFAFLMDVIDKWMVEDPGKSTGPFRFLREDACIKSIAITPNCSIHEAQLKTFLATEILGIYQWNTRSKVSYRDIQRSLGGEASKKYVFCFDCLENCLSTEAARESTRKNWARRNCWEWVEIKENCGVTMYLLECLQKAARVKLGEYWEMCASDYDLALVRPDKRIKWKPRKRNDFVEEKTQEEIYMEQKQNKYMECLMAVALHEIFTREYVESVRKQEAKRDEAVGRIHLLQEEIKDLPEKLKEKASGKDDIGMGVLEERNREMVQEILEHVNFLRTYAIDAGVRMEHMVGIVAELQLVMFLETKNLEMIERDNGIGKELTKYLKCLEDRAIDGFVKYDKNRNRYYRTLQDDMGDIFFQYMKETSSPAREAISKAVEVYFSLVGKMKFHENKEIEEKQRAREEELWKAQLVLVRPIWYWEGKTRAGVQTELE